MTKSVRFTETVLSKKVLSQSFLSFPAPIDYRDLASPFLRVLSYCVNPENVSIMKIAAEI